MARRAFPLTCLLLAGIFLGSRPRPRRSPPQGRL